MMKRVAASITTKGQTTRLSLRPAARERSVKVLRVRRLASGLCRECGTRPLATKYRCRICQNRENARWRKAYGDNFRWFKQGRVYRRKSVSGSAQRRKEKIKIFVENLSRWARVGDDPVEKISRRRSHKGRS